MGPGSRFRRVLPETEALVDDDKIRRVVLCSGKVYYDLFEERAKRGIDDVAIVRVEQLYPWPKETVMTQLSRYPNAEVVWCQEEPANMGPWTFVDRRLEFILEELAYKIPQSPLCRPQGARRRRPPACTRTMSTNRRLLVEQALTGALFTLAPAVPACHQDEPASKATK